VKIAAATDPAGTPSNDPHVGCTFYVEWFGYDQGSDVVSTVDFQAWSPTSDVTIGGTAPSQVFVGGDPAGGGTDLDGRQVYHLTFSGGAPHPKQGYHVKVTVTTPHSLGNDTKTKVFWVQPCGMSGSGEDTGPSSTPTPTPTPTETPTPTPTPSSAPTSAPTSGSGNDTSTPHSSGSSTITLTGASTAPNGVAANGAGTAPVPTTVEAGQRGATDSGSSPAPLGLALTMLGIGVVAGVGGVTVWQRRTHA
jgi:hypothetical protein